MSRALIAAIARPTVWGAFIQSGQAARVYSWIRPPWPDPVHGST